MRASRRPHVPRGHGAAPLPPRWHLERSREMGLLMSTLDSPNNPVLTASEPGRPTRVVPEKRTGSALKKADNRAAYLFLLPWITGIVLITALPMLASLYLSFTNYAVIGWPSWVGLDNYIRLFTADRRF